LRFSPAGIIILCGDNKTPNRVVELETSKPVPFGLSQMEAAMYKCLATITATLAVLAAALLVSGRAEAGASASAPSKYANRNQVAAVHQLRTNRQAQRSDFAITEYSSSSARTHAPKYR
jgi:hypothetical protein